MIANSLSFSHIENESSHKATSVALSGGTKFGTEEIKANDGATYTNNVNWRDNSTFSPNLPQQSKEEDSSTTYTTLSAGNINIGGKDTTVEELGIHSDINTANLKVDEIPDLQAVMDQQKIVADATSTIFAATRTYSQNKRDEAEAQKQAAEKQALEKLEAEGGEKWVEYNSTQNQATKQDILKGYSEEYKTASDQAQSWGMGGDSSRALTAVTTAITGLLGGQTDLQVATNTLAPYASYLIGQQFGHGEDKNTAAQLAAHAILGATLAYINGGDPAAGGSAVVASEAAAMYLTKQLEEKYKDDPKYFVNGEFQANLLSETEKAQIRDLTAGIGAVIGGAVGDSSYNAQLAGVIGQNAVENNAIQSYVKTDPKTGITTFTYCDDQDVCTSKYDGPIEQFTFFEENLIRPITFTVGVVKKSTNIKNTTQQSRQEKEIVYPNEPTARKAALALGYKETNYVTKAGAKVYKKGSSYISRDRDGHHAGGAWKEAKSPQALNKKETRNGTFDINMKKVGD